MRLPPDFPPNSVHWITGRAPFVKLWPVGTGGPVTIIECPRCRVRYWLPSKEAKH